MMGHLSKADQKFLNDVTANGGERLAPTNPYEVMRFKTRHGVGIVYENKRGTRTWNAEARAVRDHLSSRKGGSLAPVEVRGRRTGKGTVERLFERDGEECFFCGRALEGDITIEHLVAVAHGGPNHISNLFLAHDECNQAAGHLSAPEKISRAIASRSTPCDAPPVATHLPASVSEVTRQPSAATVEVGCAGTTDTPNV